MVLRRQAGGGGRKRWKWWKWRKRRKRRKRRGGEVSGDGAVGATDSGWALGMGSRQAAAHAELQRWWKEVERGRVEGCTVSVQHGLRQLRKVAHAGVVLGKGVCESDFFGRTLIQRRLRGAWGAWGGCAGWFTMYGDGW